MTETTATAKNLRISAKKMRPLADNIRGKKAGVILDSLAFANTKPATQISKVLKSAIANAEKNANLQKDSLVIKEIRVDEGPTLKRFRAVSKGSAHSILKRSSHIKIVLEDSG